MLVIDKVPMIKAMRSYADLGLKEAKDLVEFTVATNPAYFRWYDRGSGPFTPIDHSHDDVREVLRHFNRLAKDVGYIAAEIADVSIVDPELEKLVKAAHGADTPASSIADICVRMDRWELDDIRDAVKKVTDVDVRWDCIQCHFVTLW